MKNKLICIMGFLFFASLFKSGFVFSEEDDDINYLRRGPIAVKNQMPLYLFYLQMPPDNTKVTKLNKFRANLDYTVSNVTVSCFTPVSSLYEIDIDLEVSRLALDLRYGIHDNWEVGMEIPYLSLSTGYLDNTVEGFEDAIGARTPRSRERQGSYEFNYIFRYNYEYLISQKAHTEGLGDCVFNTKYQALRESGYFLPNLSLRGAVKLPTGDKDDLLGSGEFDYGLGVLVDKCFFEKLFLYGGVNIARIEKPSFFSTLGIDKEFYSGMVALEYFFTDRFSTVLQATGNSSPYPFSETNVLDNEAYEITLGFNYVFKKKEDLALCFAIVENYGAASSPDVTFHTGLSWEL